MGPRGLLLFQDLITFCTERNICSIPVKTFPSILSSGRTQKFVFAEESFFFNVVFCVSYKSQTFNKGISRGTLVQGTLRSTWGPMNQTIVDQTDQVKEFG